MAGGVDACADDPTELDALARRFGHRVGFFAERVGRRYGIEGAWRDDLESAGWWGLFQALRRRRPGAAPRELSVYVSRRIEGAVLDTARTHLRRRLRVGPLEEGGPDADPERAAAEALAAPEDDPERTATRRRRRRGVDAALRRLDPAHRRLLEAWARGDTLAEIARREGAAPATLHQRWRRALRALRAGAPELRPLVEDT